MVKLIPSYSIFLSSPSDVSKERELAINVIKKLLTRPIFKGKLGLNIIAWDSVESSPAMEARLKPQTAIKKGLPTPAECDLVFVFFWSRMGTRFRDDSDNKLYESGTHWELLNALSS